MTSLARIALIVLMSLLGTSCATFRTPALHVVGVYQGAFARPVEQPPLPKECKSPADFATRLERKEFLRDCTAAPQVDQTRRVKVMVSDTSRPIVLGLMAHSQTEWVLDVAPNVTISKIIVGGNYRQVIVGLPAYSVVDAYTIEASPCERCIQKQPYFFSYEQVPPQMEKAAGLKASSFQGRYTGESFSIFEGMQR